MPKIDYSKCDYTEANKRGLEYLDTHDIALEEIAPLKIHFQDFLAEN